MQKFFFSKQIKAASQNQKQTNGLTNPSNVKNQPNKTINHINKITHHQTNTKEEIG